MDLRERIRTYYTDRLQMGSCCGRAVSGGGSTACGGEAQPEAPDIPSFGCGDPTGFAGLQPGEAVLDLGSGAGLDAFRAAERVGPQGRVLGVDMTDAMLQRARDGAARLGIANVEFRHGLIEDLPVEDASVDVILSNCVINLSGDKPQVFREAYRVLRPGGRIRASDILRRGARLEAPTAEGWCACIDGAETPEAYAGFIEAAGFIDVHIDSPPAELAAGATYSASVRARKPEIRPLRDGEQEALARLLTDAGLPVDGLEQAEGFVLELDGDAVGGIAIEMRGASALLRSLVVRPSHRGRNMGVALLRFAEGEARRRGARAAFGLTLTIPGLLERHGFTEVSREDLPEELHASAELQGACPASARAFRKLLG